MVQWITTMLSAMANTLQPLLVNAVFLSFPQNKTLFLCFTGFAPRMKDLYDQTQIKVGRTCRPTSNVRG